MPQPDPTPLWNRVQGPVPTADGSWTLRDVDSGELFHNSAGAWTEALHHYAKPVLVGLRTPRPDARWRVFDACFGLGYATWALLDTWLQQDDPPVSIEVHAYESDGGLAAFWPQVLAQPELQRFESLRRNFPASPRHGETRVWRGFVGRCEVELRLHPTDFRRAMERPQPNLDANFDVVLHDPFTPMRAAHLWTTDIFARYHEWLADRQGCLATYSTSTAVLGGLRAAGFTLYRTPRLGKKRGGTLALTPDHLPAQTRREYGLPPEDEAALRTRSALPYRDASFQGHNASLIRVRNQEVRDSSLPRRNPKGR